jgi:hypothetical protein
VPVILTYVTAVVVTLVQNIQRESFVYTENVGRKGIPTSPMGPVCVAAVSQLALPLKRP